jgi:type II secretory pathway pseudopilin PulG
MKSTKCSACGFVGWSDGTHVCKKCGARLAPLPFGEAYQTSWDGGQLKKGLAITSLVVGILSFLTLGLFGLGAVLGIILGVVALMKTNRNPSQYGGKGMAIAGVILSAISLVVVIPFAIIAAIAIPNLLAARRAANEGSTISALRRISSAEATYQSVHETYGTLDQLAKEQLIPANLASGAWNGYVIKVSVVTREYPYPGFEAVGVPAEYPHSGRRSFFIDETGVIRVADAHGGEATRLDSPMNSDDGYSSYSPPSRRHNPEISY